MVLLEMGRSSANAKVWPNVRLGSARQASFMRLRRFALTVDVNLKSLYLLLVTTIRAPFYCQERLQ